MTNLLGINKGRNLLILGIILVLILSIVGCTKTEGEIVAKVNDEIITKDELYNILVEQGGQQVLETLITEKIINAEAEKAEIKVSDEDIQVELDKMIEGNGGEAQFNELMSYYGYNMDGIKKNITTNLKIKGLLEPSIEISDDEIKEYFENNEDSFIQEEEVRASHILVDEEEEAKKIYDDLIKGGNFEELAKEYSKDGSAQLGGDLGFFGKGEMVNEFEEVAFNLGIDEISEPVKSKFGYHIIKVVEKIEAKDANLKESEEKIRELIFEEKMPYAYQDWYEGIKEEYKIENKLTNN